MSIRKNPETYCDFWYITIDCSIFPCFKIYSSNLEILNVEFQIRIFN